MVGGSALLRYYLELEIYHNLYENRSDPMSGFVKEREEIVLFYLRYNLSR